MGKALEKHSCKDPDKTIVIGASGAIGAALVDRYAKQGHQVLALSRASVSSNKQSNIQSAFIDIEDEASIDAAAATAAKWGKPERLIIASGILHQGGLKPEKSIRQLSQHHLSKIMLVNSIGPALVMKHFLPLMPKDKGYVIAALSARVGSISDNKLGGWYGYRASKAALNMLIKTTSLEARRRNDKSIVVGLHPGTVASQLSEPFQATIPKEKLFTAEFSANKLAEVIENLNAESSGKIFAWDGQVIEY